MLTDLEKSAYIRWLSDLMKADNIIASDEIEFLESRCREFSISQIDIENSLSLSLEKACDVLKKCKAQIRNKIAKQLKDLSLSDGSCSREEALLLLALFYNLSSKTKNLSRVISFPTPNLDFADSQVIFLESHEDNILNEIISGSIKGIINDLRIGGFDFIYIPQIARHYRETDKNLLSKIIKYLAPTLTDKETDNVLHEISNMTTRTFYKAIIQEKLNLNLNIHHPSILIKIANTFVNGVKTSDFLCIKVDETIISFLRSMIEIFLDYQRCPTITIKNYIDSGGNFVYTGFYKTIFDLVTYRKGVRNKIIFNHEDSHKRVIIRGPEAINLEMGLAEAALYEFLIRESISERRCVRFNGISKKQRDKIREKFADIYMDYVGFRTNIPDITKTATRNPLLTKIRKAILKHEQVRERHSFIPIVSEGKTFIGVDSHVVFLVEGDEEREIGDY